MPKRKPPLTDEEGEARELTREDFKGMRPLGEVDPGFIKAITDFRRKLGRPKAAAPKVHIGFRLAPDVVESVRASGPGYNTRVEQALRKAGFGATHEVDVDVKASKRTKAAKTAKAALVKKRRAARQEEAKRAVSKRRA
jgi:uncharacterized protein (DUF4415 family)